MSEHLPQIMTVDEVAEYLRFSRYTVRRLLVSGKLKGTPAGNGTSRRAWRIPRENAVEFAGRGETLTPRPAPCPPRSTYKPQILV